MADRSLHIANARVRRCLVDGGLPGAGPSDEGGPSADRMLRGHDERPGGGAGQALPLTHGELPADGARAGGGGPSGHRPSPGHGAQPGLGDDEQVLVDLVIQDGRIAALHPAGRIAPRPGTDVIDQDGGEVWPCPIDIHTHLDKGHVWPRSANLHGTFEGALASAIADRDRHWTATDVHARFSFGLRCAYAHGTVAIRTHLESEAPHHQMSWPVFDALRREWAGRIHLEAAGLTVIEDFVTPFGEQLADLVADHQGVLGGFLYMHPDLEPALDRMLALAAERGLDLDLHVDESSEPGAIALRHVAQAALRHGFAGKILCGHCCSLAVQAPHEAERTLDLVRAAGISVASLPMCNLYLQDRVPGRTPRWRGVTLLHEMAARHIPIVLASDNCRDPFHAYGDHDMVEVFREATRIAHLDRPLGDWPQAICRTPAAIMGLEAGVIRKDAPADLILFRARSDAELLSRPQSDRKVLRAGRVIDSTPPDYRELDETLGLGAC